MLRLLLAFALLLPAPAAAYGVLGHETIAAVALANAKPATAARVRALLSDARLLDTPTCPAATPAAASTWADCVRALGARFSHTAPWHYQNVDICRPFDLKPACRDGNCVSAQVDRQVRLLQDRTVPHREKVAALAYLIHFVGDLHMPLHAGDRGDRGGNDVKVAYGLIEGRANLHSVWDGWIAERGITQPPGGPLALLAEVSDRAGVQTGTAEDWSREGWAVSRDIAYATALDGDPCGDKPASRLRFDEAKVRALVPTVRQQITRGGLRLARLLDEALA